MGLSGVLMDESFQFLRSASKAVPSTVAGVVTKKEKWVEILQFQRSFLHESIVGRILAAVHFYIFILQFLLRLESLLLDISDPSK